MCECAIWSLPSAYDAMHIGRKGELEVVSPDLELGADDDDGDSESDRPLDLGHDLSLYLVLCGTLFFCRRAANRL